MVDLFFNTEQNLFGIREKKTGDSRIVPTINEDYLNPFLQHENHSERSDIR